MGEVDLYPTRQPPQLAPHGVSTQQQPSQSISPTEPAIESTLLPNFDNHGLSEALVQVDGRWETVAYKPIIYQPTTKTRPPDEEFTTLINSLSGSELRDALELVNSASSNLNAAFRNSQPAMANAYNIAMFKHQSGGIDAAVLPSGKWSVSQQLEPVFQDVSLQLDLSLEASDRGFVEKIKNEHRNLGEKDSANATGDVVGASFKSKLSKWKPRIPAGLHHVCQLCEELVGLLLANLKHWPAFRQSGITIPHYHDSDVLQKSAAMCRVCYIMKMWTSKYVQYKIVPGQKRATFRVQSLHIPQATTYFLCQDHDTKPSAGQGLNISLEARNILASPNSWKGVSLLIKWLKQCLAHQHCGRPVTTPLPTRVIDVGPFGSRDTPRLVISGGKSAEYLTLSYCWGGQLPLRLTKSTMKSFTAGLDVDELPPHFRDVIFLTRLMGVRYIWIDALCNNLIYSEVVILKGPNWEPILEHMNILRRRHPSCSQPYKYP